MRPARDTWRNPALALTLCAASGAAFAALRLPLPWMIGPMLAMAACNFAGMQLRAHRAWRALGQLVIGTALGLYFSPAVMRELAAYWHLLLLAAALAIALGGLCGWVLARATGTDPTTAFFASVPGGAAEMTLLGERYGARPERIALAQSLRILVVVMVVPFGLTLAGVHGTDPYTPAAVRFDWTGMALLLATAATAGGALALARVPNAFMLGPLLVATLLTAQQIELSSIPQPLTNAGQLLLGCTLGTRFERRFLTSMPRFVAGAFASIALAIALAGATGFALAWFYRLPVPSLLLATAPGGIAEMCITAKVLELGVPLVTAAQVVRVVVLLTFTGALYRAARRWGAVRRDG